MSASTVATTASVVRAPSRRSQARNGKLKTARKPARSSGWRIPEAARKPATTTTAAAAVNNARLGGGAVTGGWAIV